MLKQLKIDPVNRILDANLNRAKEGLRVCEEVIRFVLEDKALAADFKALRHKIDFAAKSISSRQLLLIARNSSQDVGRKNQSHEMKRSSVKDIFLANIQRAKESVRVLEEFSKLKNPKPAAAFKEIRYNIYIIEKKAIARLNR